MSSCLIKTVAADGGEVMRLGEEPQRAGLDGGENWRYILGATTTDLGRCGGYDGWENCTG
jgi:hypothetical protein